jgi:hypothetical protein
MSISVTNTSAQLSNSTILTEEDAATIEALHTFDRGTNAPFAVVSGAAKVDNLDADKLDGQEGTYYSPSVVTTTATGTNNDLVLSLVGRRVIVRCNNASDLTITGFTAGADGQQVTFVAIGAGNVYFAHQSSSSSAANRLINAATSGNTPLVSTAANWATYTYDNTTQRWRLTSHEQGGWITSTFSDADYVGFDGAAEDNADWVVGAGDRSTAAYRLVGKTLHVAFVVGTTTIANAPTSLRIKNGQYGSYTTTKTVIIPAWGRDAGGNIEYYAASSPSAGTDIRFERLGALGAFTNTTDLMSVNLCGAFEVD